MTRGGSDAGYLRGSGDGRQNAPGRPRPKRGQFKMTLAQEARTMSYYNPTPKQYNFITADRSLFILSPHNRIRKLAKKIIEWPYPFTFFICLLLDCHLCTTAAFIQLGECIL